jgi:hypothetical protein
MVGHLASLVTQARDAKQLDTHEDPLVVAQALLSTFASEIRRWIAADDPALKAGLTRLRRMLALQVTGLAPRAGALEKNKRKK